MNIGDNKITVNRRIKNKKNWLINGIILFELILIFHFSSDSPDYLNYISLINNPIPQPQSLLDFLNTDFFFYLVVNFLKITGLTTENIILTIPAAAVLIKNNIFKKMTNGIYISFLYGISLFWIFDLIQLRLSIASTLLIIAFWEYYKNRLCNYYLFLTASILCHASTLVFLLLNLTKSLGKWKFTIITVLVIIGAIYFSAYFYSIITELEIDRINRYNSGPLEIKKSPGIITSVTILSFVQILIFLTRKNASQESSLSKLLMPAPFIALLSIVICYQIPVLAIRISQLMFLPVILNYSLIMHKSNVYLKIILLFIMSIGLIYSFPIKHFLIKAFIS